MFGERGVRASGGIPWEPSMTLPPVETSRMTIDPRRYVWCVAPEYTGYCAIPGCNSKFRLEKHHIVRRSATGGPLDYITIDGLVVQNTTMLCREHHNMITGSIGGHKLWIVWQPPGMPACWHVFTPGYYEDKNYLIAKDGSTWVWLGMLRTANRQAAHV